MIYSSLGGDINLLQRDSEIARIQSMETEEDCRKRGRPKKFSFNNIINTNIPVRKEQTASKEPGIRKKSIKKTIAAKKSIGQKFSRSKSKFKRPHSSSVKENEDPSLYISTRGILLSYLVRKRMKLE